ncbi:hypothetical protein BY458DRAFT_547555 [Sporodiniella umbellata]|nr:hypothetical protein BY458DRAFT_547555 [Sporodiniella umbellata]
MNSDPRIYRIHGLQLNFLLLKKQLYFCLSYGSKNKNIVLKFYGFLLLSEDYNNYFIPHGRERYSHVFVIEATFFCLKSKLCKITKFFVHVAILRSTSTKSAKPSLTLYESIDQKKAFVFRMSVCFYFWKRGSVGGGTFSTLVLQINYRQSTNEMLLRRYIKLRISVTICT